MNNMDTRLESAQSSVSSAREVPAIDRLSIALHWLVGWTIIGLLGLGLYMVEYEAYEFYDLHKSLGTLIFVAVVIRAWRRVRQGWPEPVGQYSSAEQLLSKLVHYILLIGSVMIPLSGIVMSAASGWGLSVFGLELIPVNEDPVTGDVTAFSETLDELAYNVHGLASNLVIASVVLHIVGALKHHFIDKDSTLKRMIGR